MQIIIDYDNNSFSQLIAIQTLPVDMIDILFLFDITILYQPSIYGSSVEQ